ncbi:MAG: hypothetical protein FP817_04485, partial [Propionicimonas sp.]|nr:hypothetical protein [Propionicimonas sp.]
VAVGVGVAHFVSVAVGVGVAHFVSVAVGVGVAHFVSVAVAVAVGVGVGVAHSVANRADKRGPVYERRPRDRLASGTLCPVMGVGSNLAGYPTPGRCRPRTGPVPPPRSRAGANAKDRIGANSRRP